MEDLLTMFFFTISNISVLTSWQVTKGLRCWGKINFARFKLRFSSKRYKSILLSPIIYYTKPIGSDGRPTFNGMVLFCYFVVILNCFKSLTEMSY